MTELNLEPYKYQIDDMWFLITNKKAALLHEPGVGKTFGVLLAVTYLIEVKSYRALIIMPPVLLDTWVDKLYGYFNTDISSVVYRGVKAKRQKINLEKYSIVFISYNLFQRDYKRFKDSHFNIIVADETKFIKKGEVRVSSKTGLMNTFGAVQAKANKAEYVFLMNGTPVTKSPEDVFHILHLINPNIFVSKKNFINYFAVKQIIDGFPRIVSWKNLNKLEQLLKKYTKRLLKHDVLDLPKKQLILKQFKLNEKHHTLVKELWDFGFLELATEGTFLEGMALLMTVRQAIMDPSLVELNEISAAFEVLDSLLEDLKDKQVIIFAHFQNTMTLLKEHLKNYTYAELHGKTKNKEIEVQKFKSGEAQLLLANPSSAGYGLDFQNCHNVIFFEIDYAVDNFWQGQDRVYRPGQTEDVNIFVLLPVATPIVTIFRSIKENINYVEQILKNKESATKFWEDKITVAEEEEWRSL